MIFQQNLWEYYRIEHIMEELHIEIFGDVRHPAKKHSGQGRSNVRHRWWMG